MTDPQAGTTEFASRYGPWALVLGASEGVGRAYAEAMADRGLNVALVSRRQAALDEVAAGITERAGVETRTIALDLTEPDATGSLIEATKDLEVGMVMYCAGADPNYQPFLDQPVDASLSLVQRNCLVPLQVCHHFAPAMVERGRGGIVLVSSMAGLVGSANTVAYSASKSFDMVLAEGLWAELHDKGVDVLGLVLGATDTPALRRLLVKRGNQAAADPNASLPGVATPADAVTEALAHLTDGPTRFAGDQLQKIARGLASMDRNDAVRVMLENAPRSIMGSGGG